MASTKTKYIVIEWEEGEWLWIDSAEEVKSWCRDFLKTFDFDQYDEIDTRSDMCLTILRCTPGQRPKEIKFIIKSELVWSLESVS